MILSDSFTLSRITFDGIASIGSCFVFTYDEGIPCYILEILDDHISSLEFAKLVHRILARAGLEKDRVAVSSISSCEETLVNAFRTDNDGLPYLDTFNDKDYDVTSDNVDPRLFLTVGMPGFPYEFNTKYMMDKSSTWSRSNGLYGYYVTLKQNVDPDSGYLIKGGWWGSSMNHIVLRYADVLLMRAEALIQLNDGRIGEAISLINELRNRASQSTTMIADYPSQYGVTFYVKPYTGSYTQDEALKILKFERRVELAMECDRFFDLVRWGEADQVLNKYYAEEANDCSVYSNASFTKNKNEYLPIPFAQISASNGHYSQNCGGW